MGLWRRASPLYLSLSVNLLKASSRTKTLVRTMRNYRLSSHIALILALSACLATPMALAQGAPGGGNAPPFQAGAAMTLYHVLTAGNGQQYYLNQFGQAIQLPGAGSADPNTVAIYTGNGGESWYVDKTGKEVDLPPVTTAPPVEPYYGYGYGFGQPSPYYAPPAEGQPPEQAQQQPSTVNIINEPSTSSSTGSGGSSGGSSGVGTALAAGLGAAAGAFGGAALAWAIDGIPYGVPIYPPVFAGGFPYYIGADGNQVFLNKTVNNTWINNWNKENNWYNRQVNDRNGRYHNNWWPGKEHGFPRPGQQVPGRLYSPTPGGQRAAGNLAERSGGFGRFGGDSWGQHVFGGGHFGDFGGGHFGGFGGSHFGGFGGGHFSGFGGFRR